MNKKIVEAVSGTLNEKPRISGMAGNLTDKLSLSKASFRKPEISGIEKNREYRNVKAGLQGAKDCRNGKELGT